MDRLDAAFEILLRITGGLEGGAITIFQRVSGFFEEGVLG